MINKPQNDWLVQSASIEEDSIEKLFAIIKADCVDYDMYKEIYSLIPKELIVEEDKPMWKKEQLWFDTKCTKWRLDKIDHADLIKRLQSFAKEKNLIKNQLAFNNLNTPQPDIDMRTIYKSN